MIFRVFLCVVYVGVYSTYGASFIVTQSEKGGFYPHVAEEVAAEILGGDEQGREEELSPSALSWQACQLHNVFHVGVACSYRPYSFVLISQIQALNDISQESAGLSKRIKLYVDNLRVPCRELTPRDHVLRVVVMLLELSGYAEHVAVAQASRLVVLEKNADASHCHLLCPVEIVQALLAFNGGVYVDRKGLHVGVPRESLWWGEIPEDMPKGFLRVEYADDEKPPAYVPPPSPPPYGAERRPCASSLSVTSSGCSRGGAIPLPRSSRGILPPPAYDSVEMKNDLQRNSEAR